jgi:hypothetical protein
MGDPKIREKYENLPIVEAEDKEYSEEEIKDVNSIEVADPTVLTSTYSKPELKIKKVLQKGPTKWRVQFTDNSTGWIDKDRIEPEDNKIIYM